MSERLRLDTLLVTRGLCASRSQAQSLIREGKVRSGDTVLDKPGRELPVDTPLAIEAPPRFVSRGGDKLDAFLTAFALDLTDAYVLDVGASTGGFTDCALQRGAASVTCVDVGQDQLHPTLRSDPRVTNIERVNARHLDPAILPRPTYDLAVLDLSFISLRHVLPAIWPLVAPGGRLIALVKPQFEAGREAVSRGDGVIRDPAVQQRTLDEVTAFAEQNLPGAVRIGAIDSPIRGGDGNREFLLGLRKGAPPAANC